MNYPFLGYNTPGLQLGQPGGLSGNVQSLPYNTGALTPSVDFNATGVMPSYQSLGESIGSINPDSLPTPQTGWLGKTNNWMSNNADLMKAGIGAVTGGIGAWQGMQQNKLIQKSMQQQAGQFREQMNLSKQNINRNLEDRQRARVASNPVAYESVDSYMKKYGVK